MEKKSPALENINIGFALEITANEMDNEKIMTEAEQIKLLKEALEWYAEQAMRLNAYILELDQSLMMTTVKILALDNGKMAREALKK